MFADTVRGREEKIVRKRKTFQEAKEELSSAKSSSASELDKARMRLASTEEKVQELEDEVFTANETTSRIRDEIRKYQNEVVPALENKVKALEEELLRSGESAKVSVGKRTEWSRPFISLPHRNKLTVKACKRAVQEQSKGVY